MVLKGRAGTEMKLEVVSLGESAPGEGFSVRESAPGKVFSLRESPPGAARQRVTFLAGTRKVTKRSALKCKRTFDRACEPVVATAPLEFRLEMRSVCAVPYVPPQLRGTGAPAVPPNSLTNASRPCRASAAGLLIPGAVLQMRSAAQCLASTDARRYGSGGRAASWRTEVDHPIAPSALLLQGESAAAPARVGFTR